MPDLESVWSRIGQASRRLEGVAKRTPILTSRSLDERAGRSVFLKSEHLQTIGAFKIRGAYNAMAALGDEAKRRGVLTYSSGNHAQAIARSGQLLGVDVVVVMPDNAPPVKRALSA